MATRKSKINKFYALYATEHMIIDEDNNGLYYSIMSETEENKSYTVRVDESAEIPVVGSCNCDANGECKHQIIATAFIKRIYKSNIAKAAEAAKVEPVVSPVVEEVPPIAMELAAELRGYRKTAVSVDTSALNGAQQSAGVLMALPSRRAYVSSLQEKQERKSNLLAEMREIREKRAI